jgi:hypothetical protein
LRDRHLQALIEVVAKMAKNQGKSG